MTAAMTVYLAFMAFIYVLSMIHDLFRLSQNDYPRIEHITPGKDVLGIVVAGGMLVWVMILLL